ncbi:hypothetical protein HK099_004774 [Clydaea vesicula]|uniref:Uncharacterized protein n=1 Tax=Clydaea vesicula TaxID=447962 RepID=A0AAD5U4N8_9FUNG|nr:hypothetical protein HK099_004774 [Clydaea vesicula]
MHNTVKFRLYDFFARNFRSLSLPPPALDDTNDVLFGLPVKLDNPASPRSKIIVKFDEENFFGEVTYFTAHNVQAVWLDNLVGLTNVECSSDDNLSLTFDPEVAVKFPEVWGELPVIVLISQRYTSCIKNKNEMTLPVRKILGIKSISNNVLVAEAKLINFDDVIEKADFKFSSKEGQQSNNSTLQKRIGGNLGVHTNLNNIRLVETKDVPGCKECNILIKNLAIDYSFRWEAYGSIGGYAVVEINGSGRDNVDIDFLLTSDLIEWKSDKKNFFTMTLGPTIYIPQVLELGFFFKMEVVIAIALKGKLKLSTGFDSELTPLFFRWDSRFGTEAKGGEMKANYHGSKIALTAEVTPKLEVTPMLAFNIQFGSKANEVGVGLKNVFEFPLIIKLFGGSCDLTFEVVYKPDIIVRTFDSDHTILRFPKFTLFSKCIWKDMSEPEGPNGPDGGVIEPQPHCWEGFSLCGKKLNFNDDNLYTCFQKKWVLKQICNKGCYSNVIFSDVCNLDSTITNPPHSLLCKPGKVECGNFLFIDSKTGAVANDGNLWRCNSDGYSFSRIQNCPNSLCNNGSCQKKCTGGDIKCGQDAGKNDENLYICSNDRNSFVLKERCPDKCDYFNKECRKKCVPNARYCGNDGWGKDVYQCTSDGYAYSFAQKCSNSGCRWGECQPPYCIPGKDYCGRFGNMRGASGLMEDSLYTCSADSNSYQLKTDCTKFNTYCQSSGDYGRCRPICEPNSEFCGKDETLHKCSADGLTSTFVKKCAYKCITDKCADTCVPGEKLCGRLGNFYFPELKLISEAVYTCAPDSKYIFDKDCGLMPGSLCFNGGTCKQICEPNKEFCARDGTDILNRCNTDGYGFSMVKNCDYGCYNHSPNDICRQVCNPGEDLCGRLGNHYNPALNLVSEAVYTCGENSNYTFKKDCNLIPGSSCLNGGKCSQICNPGREFCSLDGKNVINKCNEDGLGFTVSKKCEYGCLSSAPDATCTDVCIPGEKLCGRLGNYYNPELNLIPEAVYTCETNNTYNFNQDCNLIPGSSCLNGGICSQTCEPNREFCSRDGENTLNKCNKDGLGFTMLKKCSKSCINGFPNDRCGEICTPGEDICGGLINYNNPGLNLVTNSVYTCASDLTFTFKKQCEICGRVNNQVDCVSETTCSPEKLYCGKEADGTNIVNVCNSDGSGFTLLKKCEKGCSHGNCESTVSNIADYFCGSELIALDSSYSTSVISNALYYFTDRDDKNITFNLIEECSGKCKVGPKSPQTLYNGYCESTCIENKLYCGKTLKYRGFYGGLFGFYEEAVYKCGQGNTVGEIEQKCSGGCKPPINNENAVCDAYCVANIDYCGSQLIERDHSFKNIESPDTLYHCLKGNIVTKTKNCLGGCQKGGFSTFGGEYNATCLPDPVIIECSETNKCTNESFYCYQNKCVIDYNFKVTFKDTSKYQDKHNLEQSIIKELSELTTINPLDVFVWIFIIPRHSSVGIIEFIKNNPFVSSVDVCKEKSCTMTITLKVTYISGEDTKPYFGNYTIQQYTMLVLNSNLNIEAAWTLEGVSTYKVVFQSSTVTFPDVMNILSEAPSIESVELLSTIL